MQSSGGTTTWTGGGGGGMFNGNQELYWWIGDGGSGVRYSSLFGSVTAAAKATGGAVSYYGDKTIHTFTIIQFATTKLVMQQM